MIERILEKELQRVVRKFSVVAVTGPRQSGKTTLVRNTFPDWKYVSLEDPDNREFATEDPRRFLTTYSGQTIIDEAQRSPDLFSYLQTVVDEKQVAGQYILTGSQNFLMHEGVSQSLAGRVYIMKLAPLSQKELTQSNQLPGKYEEAIFRGAYPAVIAKDISPLDWYPSYIQTYVERDVRLVKNILDFDQFQKFLKMCAGRTGQIVNFSALANDCGITHNTAKSWLRLLEMSFIIFLIQPFYRNYNKRLVKMPKLYFYDTGLVCSLLGVQSPTQLEAHFMRGQLFETLVISELLKMRLNNGLSPNLYFWRDKAGHEIDCIVEQGDHLLSVEIKAGQTISSDFFKELVYWQKLTRADAQDSYLIYGGTQPQTRQHASVIGWNQIGDVPILP